MVLCPSSNAGQYVPEVACDGVVPFHMFISVWVVFIIFKIIEILELRLLVFY